MSTDFLLQHTFNFWFFYLIEYYLVLRLLYDKRAPRSLRETIAITDMPLTTACIGASVTPTVLSTWFAHVRLYLSIDLAFGL